MIIFVICAKQETVPYFAFKSKKCGKLLAVFLCRQDLLAKNEATKKVIRSLPHRALLCMRNGSVTVEISVPLAALLIGEVRDGILVSLVVPLLILFISGEKMCDKRRYESFVMYPPQLHIIFELLTRSAIEITEIIYAVKLFIPTYIQRPIEYV